MWLRPKALPFQQRRFISNHSLIEWTKVLRKKPSLTGDQERQIWIVEGFSVEGSLLARFSSSVLVTRAELKFAFFTSSNRCNPWANIVTNRWRGRSNENSHFVVVVAKHVRFSCTIKMQQFLSQRYINSSIVRVFLHRVGSSVSWNHRSSPCHWISFDFCRHHGKNRNVYFVVSQIFQSETIRLSDVSYC